MTVGRGLSSLSSWLRRGRPRTGRAGLAELAEFPEMNPGPVCRLDQAGTVRVVNVAARRIFGDEHLVGRSWLDLCPGMDGELWRRVIDSDTPLIHEAEIGGVCVAFTHVRSNRGDLVFAYGADITARRRAEQQLAEKAAALAEVARFPDVNPGPVLRLGLDGIVLLANVLTTAGRDLLQSIEQQGRERAVRPGDLDALMRSDREAGVEDWLDEHGVANPWDLAPLLVGQGLDPPALSRLAAIFEGEALSAVLAWAASAFQVYTLLHEIGQGSARVSEIVGALKSYSYLGQAPVQPVDLHAPGKGTGLGLSTTYAIVTDKHKGEISVESRPGFTRFTVRLPIEPPSAAALVAAGTEPNPPSS